MKSCCVLFKNEAYQKSTRNLVAQFNEAGFNVDEWLVNDLFLAGRFDKQYFQLFDFIVVGSGGQFLNLLINSLVECEKRPFVISLFPGVVCHTQIDAFLSRIRADLVLINSMKDYLFYSDILSFLSLKNNAVIGGINWFTGNKSALNKSAEKVVFFEQINIPEARKDRVNLLYLLNSFAKSTLGQKVYIQPREEFISDENSLASLVLSYPMSHLIISEEKTNDVMEDMDFGLTISSSVVFEALLLNRRVFVIDDFGGGDSYINIYKGSGLITSLKGLDARKIRNMRVDKSWSLCNVIAPRKTLSEILSLDNQHNINNFTSSISLGGFVKLFLFFIFKNNDSLRGRWKKLKNVKKILDTKDKGRVF